MRCCCVGRCCTWPLLDNCLSEMAFRRVVGVWCNSVDTKPASPVAQPQAMKAAPAAATASPAKPSAGPSPSAERASAKAEANKRDVFTLGVSPSHFSPNDAVAALDLGFGWLGVAACSFAARWPCCTGFTSLKSDIVFVLQMTQTHEGSTDKGAYVQHRIGTKRQKHFYRVIGPLALYILDRWNSMVVISSPGLKF